MSSCREDIEAAFADLDAAFEAVAELSFDAITACERQRLLARLETHRRRLPAVEHPLINQLAAEPAPEALGAASLAEALATGLRISKSMAKQRISEADELGRRTALSGDLLDPVLPTVATAQAAGLVGAEHIEVIRKFFSKLPDAIDYQTREEAEKDLGRLATEFGPAELRRAADRLAYVLDQDGPVPTDADRARRRFFTIGKQRADGMTPFHGLFDPEGRATMEAVLAKTAAPGMCNPDDIKPCVDEQPPDAASQTDLRTQPQRNHDALTAMGRAMLASGQLGQHNGLPATIVVSTTLKELESAAGHGITASGSLLPMSDVIRMASHAYHYLVIFEEHTREPLYLGRTKRLASRGQRIILHARDRGCTFPGCTVPGYGCQVHHAKRGWARGGQTNVDEVVLACPPHNRLVEKAGWVTRIRADGRVEWIPPPQLDSGQARVNDYHHPENYLLCDD
ncbi:MAG: hypothetical protein QOJ24_3291 [Mycobacterium sp.]|jgi:hypothetical protein|nr:hypothetical protein [Mycobacterium sp.]